MLILGVVHSAFTFKLFPSFNERAMWFLSAGLLLMLLAAGNLLRIRYAAVAGGLRAVCIAANLVNLIFVIATASTLTISKNPQAVVLVGLIAGMTIFSILRHPERA